MRGGGGRVGRGLSTRPTLPRSRFANLAGAAIALCELHPQLHHRGPRRPRTRRLVQRAGGRAVRRGLRRHHPPLRLALHRGRRQARHAAARRRPSNTPRRSTCAPPSRQRRPKRGGTSPFRRPASGQSSEVQETGDALRDDLEDPAGCAAAALLRRDRSTWMPSGPPWRDKPEGAQPAPSWAGRSLAPRRVRPGALPLCARRPGAAALDRRPRAAAAPRPQEVVPPLATGRDWVAAAPPAAAAGAGGGAVRRGQRSPQAFLALSRRRAARENNVQARARASAVTMAAEALTDEQTAAARAAAARWAGRALAVLVPSAPDDGWDWLSADEMAEAGGCIRSTTTRGLRATWPSAAVAVAAVPAGRQPGQVGRRGGSAQQLTDAQQQEALDALFVDRARAREPLRVASP